MSRLTFLAALVLCFSLTLSAQWSNQKKDKGRDPKIRNVEGIVTVPSGSPAQGAVVKIKNMKTLQVTSFITPADGKYRFQNLSTSIDYEIRADKDDLSSDKRTLSIFDSRFEAIINLPLSKQTEKEKESSQ
jgi:hypothetical protein